MTVIELNNRGNVLQIEEFDDHTGTVVVRSHTKFFWRVLWSTLLLPAIVAGSGFVFVPVVVAVEQPPNAEFDEIVLGVACSSIFAVLGLLRAVAGLTAWLRLVFPRTLAFDLRSRSCQLENVPGFDCKIPIDDIDSVVVGSVVQWNGCLPMLCLKIRGWKRLLRVHQDLCTCESPEVAMERMESPAEYLSQLLDRPISRVGKIGLFRTSWR